MVEVSLKGLPLPIQLLLVEELKEEPEKLVEKPKPKQEEKKQGRPKRNFIYKTNFSVERKTRLVESKRKGKLKEFAAKVDNTNFRLLVRIDDIDTLYDTFSKLQEISAQSDLIDAYEEVNQVGNTTGYYILRLENLSWDNSFTILIVPGERINFSYMVAEWYE